MLEVCIRDQRWEGASVVCPLPRNGNSLCPGLSKCLLEFSELKTQAKGEICEEIGPEILSILFSHRVVRRTAERALISVSSPWGLAHGFWYNLLHFHFMPVYLKPLILNL